MGVLSVTISMADCRDYIHWDHPNSPFGVSCRASKTVQNHRAALQTKPKHPRTLSSITLGPPSKSIRPTMRCSSKASSAFLCLSTLTTAQTLIVTYYESTSCCSGAPVKVMQRPEQGCQYFQHGVSQSYLLAGDESDASFYMVYFSDSECTLDNIIKKADLG
jgi:hypothetical protein